MCIRTKEIVAERVQNMIKIKRQSHTVSPRSHQVVCKANVKTVLIYSPLVLWQQPQLLKKCICFTKSIWFYVAPFSPNKLGCNSIAP